MYTIPFIQYLRPDGHPIAVVFNTTDPVVAEKAKKILKAGFRFECEVLKTGIGSFTISDSHGDYIHHLVDDCAINPMVVKTIEAMILDADISVLRHASLLRGDPE